MRDAIHKLRGLLFECNTLTERLSSCVSERRMYADLAPMVDASRHAVLCAMRCAHATELAAKLIPPPEGS